MGALRGRPRLGTEATDSPVARATLRPTGRRRPNAERAPFVLNQSPDEQPVVVMLHVTQRTFVDVFAAVWGVSGIVPGAIITATVSSVGAASKRLFRLEHAHGYLRRA